MSTATRYSLIDKLTRQATLALTCYNSSFHVGHKLNTVTTIKTRASDSLLQTLELNGDDAPRRAQGSSVNLIS